MLVIPGNLDAFTMTVDGEVFEVSTPADHPNDRHFAWLSGPNEGYGFGLGAGPDTRWTRTKLAKEIRIFLSMIDPATGYIADD